MKLLSSLFVSALFAASATVAMADTLTLASYGTTNSAPTGVANSATQFNGAVVMDVPPVMGPGPTYDIGTGGVWTNPTGSSSWVGINKQDFPGGSNVEPFGVYDYTSTFFIGNASHSVGTLTVMADDTTDVYLNGVELVDAANFFDPGAHCTAAQPNCISPLTINLSNLVNGTNTLRFDVHQDYGSATGLDFSGTITNVTPEPDSLLLLGTGLSMLAGVARFRRVQA